VIKIINPRAKLTDDLFSASIKKMGTRDGYGHALLELAREDPRIVALTADLPESTRVLAFKKEFPDRFFDTGVAEQNMVGIAAGLALEGKIPFAASFGVFSPALTWGQIRLSVCYNDANAKIAASHTGTTTGADGASHQATEDIAIMRCLPNMIVLVPCDYLDTKKATIAAAEYKGPVYLRFGRDKVAAITTEQTPFKIGRAEVFREGKDITLVACGIMVYEALKAAAELDKEGISARVINNHTIKPLDKETILEAAKETGAFVTAEEHQIMGGMGSAVTEFLAAHHPIPVEMVGLKDTFGESGSPKELMEKYGLTSKNIVEAAQRVLKRK